MDFVAQGLEREFWKAIEKRAKGLESAGVLFSAGIDSATIAKAVSLRIPETTLFCAGLEGSKDIEFARKSAKEMNIRLVEKTIPESEIRPTLLRVKKILAPLKLDDSLNLQVGVSEHFGMKAAKEFGAKTIFMGQGADELFAGYDAFRKIVKEKGLKAVNAECKRFFEKAARIDLKRDFAIAKSLGLELRLPFCDREFAEFCLKIPASQKIHSKDDLLRKHALRRLAQNIGVPEISCNRPKKAMQYGSSVGKKVIRLLR